MYRLTILLAAYICQSFAEFNLNFVLIVESSEPEVTKWLSSAISKAEVGNPGSKVSETVIFLDRNRSEDAYEKLCSALANGVSAIVDLSWTPWEKLQDLAESRGVVVVRSQLGNQGVVNAFNSVLDARNATDVAIIFENERELDQGLYELLQVSQVRLWVHAGLTRDSAKALRNMRPDPNFYAIVGTSVFVQDIYARALSESLINFSYRWNFVITDYGEMNIDSIMLPAAILTVTKHECCFLSGMAENCNCPDNFYMKKSQKILEALLEYLVQTFARVESELPSLKMAVECQTMSKMSDNNVTREVIHRQFIDDTEANNDTIFYWNSDRLSLLLRSQYRLQIIHNRTSVESAAVWTAGEPFQTLPDVQLPQIRRFFRIGTTPSVPWTMHDLDPETGKPRFTSEGKPVFSGYCIDFIKKLSEIMDFDYEITPPKSGTFGEKLANGSWDGLVGDLASGETDMAVAALVMTAEKEEVIDFVAPYFDQTGISIVIRKPTRKTSLFKFMTVLRSEVWLSIIAALILTAVMIWLLDKYSPYSARNNPEAYPYPCRDFSLRESFWFALTSFTPQGGGEAPKALSGRTLVAAYWLFVVLMLATFTANLAAFLTVERMQAPVSSLEQLARQSRINYTVVEGSSTHQYFINMKFAEDTLYRVWKEITLNATSDQARYRVWDYPIREQYGHILLAINASGPVENASVGFKEVEDHTDADFAFIHDAAQVRYEVTRNCNLTEVGEVFAEQPYAVAVQQGSKLQEEISKAILDLQKDRYLEFLTNRYWNQSIRSKCPDSDESEGITLESLGGVFIATLVGLGLAMLTLLWEVIYYKRKEKNKVEAVEGKKLAGIDASTKQRKKIKNKDGGIKTGVTIGGDTFKPAAALRNTKGVSFIKVYPRHNEVYNP